MEGDESGTIDERQGTEAARGLVRPGCGGEGGISRREDLRELGSSYELNARRPESEGESGDGTEDPGEPTP
ncbi:MAG: hypothetical protein EDS66_07120 [Planctomycetota bacterium]|nr:MAG: hypothetical protein EDS66_07120 [Planctomycetota bacterium]MCQ3920852.1 hypothetical protein [Planctomycetota bacterium]